MTTLVVTPTYNERDNLPRFVAAVLAADSDVEVLIVDDNSPDGTGEVAEALAHRDSRVHVLHRSGKLGLGTAYVAGFRYALERGYERIVQMDADFSHRPEDLPGVLEAAQTADVVLGSRYVKGGRVLGWSLMRHVISRGGSLYARLLLGVPYRDCTSGFKCFHQSVLRHLNLSAVRASGFAFNVEMNCLSYRAGFQIAEVPITFPDRTVGRSKLTRSIVAEAALLVWRMRRIAVPGLPRPSFAPLPLPRIDSPLASA